MNPLCQCGCGQEVTKPTNRFILGHGIKRKLSDEQFQELKKLRAEGWSTYRLAERYGITPPWALELADHRGYIDRNEPSSYSAPKTTAADVAATKERVSWWKAKRKLREVRKYLKPLV